MQEEFGARFQGAFQKVLSQHDIQHLDYQRISNPTKRARAEKLSNILVAHKQRWGQRARETVMTIEEGVPSKRTHERQLFEGVDLDKAIDDNGLRELADMTDQFFVERGNLLGGDRERMRRAFNITRNKVIAGADLKETNVQGAEIIRMILGPMSEGVEIAKVSEDEFIDMFDSMVSSVFKDNAEVFFPRNVFDTVADGQLLPPDAWKSRGVNGVSGVRVSNSLLNREANEAITHPDDLASMAQTMAELGGRPTKQFTDLQRASQVVWSKATVEKPALVRRLNFVESLAKYHDTTARTLALTDAPSVEVLAANKEIRDSLKAQMIVASSDDVGGVGYSSIKSKQRALYGETPDNVLEPISDSMARGVAPPGGFGVADATGRRCRTTGMPNVC